MRKADQDCAKGRDADGERWRWKELQERELQEKVRASRERESFKREESLLNKSEQKREREEQREREVPPGSNPHPLACTNNIVNKQ